MPIRFKIVVTCETMQIMPGKEMITLFITGNIDALQQLKNAPSIAQFTTSITKAYGCFGATTLTVMCNDKVARTDIETTVIRPAIRSLGLDATFKISYENQVLNTLFDGVAHLARMEQEERAIAPRPPAP